jgi:hypothetical protein
MPFTMQAAQVWSGWAGAFPQERKPTLGNTGREGGHGARLS